MRKLLASVLLLMGATVVPARAGEVNLGWSASEGATGYRVYQGPSSGNYLTSQDAPGYNVPVSVVLPDCAMSYMAVTAYNSAGESGYSEEVSTWPRAVLTSATPDEVVQGESHSIEIVGTNFQPGDNIVVAQVGVMLDSFTVNDCNKATLGITVTEAAELGPVLVNVVHPNGVTAISNSLFSIMPPPAPEPPVDLYLE